MQIDTIPGDDPDRFWNGVEVEVLRDEAEGSILDGDFPADPSSG